uniref:Uncharacterized protein n=1 Tax=viral metagenome TaxID=1070528 RepID=A0A6C0D9D7_9ZZZZ
MDITDSYAITHIDTQLYPSLINQRKLRPQIIKDIPQDSLIKYKLVNNEWCEVNNITWINENKNINTISSCGFVRLIDLNLDQNKVIELQNKITQERERINTERRIFDEQLQQEVQRRRERGLSFFYEGNDLIPTRPVNISTAYSIAMDIHQKFVELRSSLYNFYIYLDDGSKTRLFSLTEFKNKFKNIFDNKINSLDYSDNVILCKKIISRLDKKIINMIYINNTRFLTERIGLTNITIGELYIRLANALVELDNISFINFIKTYAVSVLNAYSNFENNYIDSLLDNSQNESCDGGWVERLLLVTLQELQYKPNLKINFSPKLLLLQTNYIEKNNLFLSKPLFDTSKINIIINDYCNQWIESSENNNIIDYNSTIKNICESIILKIKNDYEILDIELINKIIFDDLTSYMSLTENKISI